MRVLLNLFVIISISAIFQFCATTERAANTAENQTPRAERVGSNATTPPTIVYRTRSDYSNQVAVTLNEDRTKIISYPHPKDLYLNGKLAKPTSLGNGYLLDNQGINTQVAFISFTFEQYANLDTPPTLDELWEKLVDKDPLLMLCNCGSRYQYQSIEKDLKALVKQDLKSCEKIIAKAKEY